MHSEQNVCAHVRVVIGSVNGARQMQQTYMFLSSIVRVPIENKLTRLVFGVST